MSAATTSKKRPRSKRNERQDEQPVNTPESPSTVPRKHSVEIMQLSELSPAGYNPRRINDHAMEGLRSSLRRFGCVEPIVWNKRSSNVVGGHQRLKVLLAEGVTEEHVVVVDLPESKEKALNVALNSPSIQGEFTEALDALLDEIQQDEPALYDELLLLELRDPAADLEIEESQAPELPDEAVTRRGDVWVLGEHRLMCGDSSSKQDLDTLLGGAPIHMVNTDPPYNVKVEPRSNNAIAAGSSSFSAPAKKSRTHHQSLDVARHPEKSKATHGKMRAKDRPLINDFVTDEEFDRLLMAWFGNIARVLQPGGAFYIWGGYANCANYPPALKACKLYFSQALIWVKEHPVLTRKDFMGNHEWCFYGWKEGAAHRFLGPNNVSDTWSVKKVSQSSMVHLTEKPVELAARAIHYSSKPGEHVLDLFGGSGSTMMAAEQLGRRGFSMELDELYCDVICQRWMEQSGTSPVRESDGKRFGDLVKEAQGNRENQARDDVQAEDGIESSAESGSSDQDGESDNRAPRTRRKKGSAPAAMATASASEKESHAK